MADEIVRLKAELEDALSKHEERLSEKTETLKQNIQYYGGKC